MIENNMKNLQSLMDNGGNVYLFTNENVSAYMSNLNMAGARVLTVGASGDQALFAYQMGARHVDTFDANNLQHAVIDLKWNMIKNISYENFIKFFLYPDTFFNLKLIEPIMEKLPNHVLDFLELYRIKGKEIIRYRGMLYSKLAQKISYLNNENAYYKLREILPADVSFVHTDIRNVINNFSGKYDVILLSNIMDYLYKCDKTVTNTKTMFDEILSPMADKLLADNGVIEYNYMWCGESNEFANQILPDGKHREYKDDDINRAIKSEYNFTSVSIPAILEKEYGDYAKLMRKTISQHSM